MRADVTAILRLLESVWKSVEPHDPPDRPDWPLVRTAAMYRMAWLGPSLVLSAPTRIEILGVVNRQREGEDHVVARVRYAVDRGRRAPLGERIVHLDERWTLSRVRESWRLASVAGDPLAGPLLESPLIATAADDIDRLTEASLEELAGDRWPHPDELVDSTALPAAQLLDLSLADDRFSPALIAARLSHIIAAWEEATDEASGPLREVATLTATNALLQSDDGGRFVRDAQLRHWTIVELDASNRPPRLVIAVSVSAAVYFGEGLSAPRNDHPARTFDLTWTLELHHGPNSGPNWRLVSSVET